MDWSRNFDLCWDAQMVSTSKYRRFWEEVANLYLNVVIGGRFERIEIRVVSKQSSAPPTLVWRRTRLLGDNPNLDALKSPPITAFKYKLPTSSRKRRYLLVETI